LSLCLTNYALRHEDVWGSGCIDPCIRDLGTTWRSGSRHGRFTSRERAAGTYWIGGCVGPQNRSGRRREEQNLAPHRDSNSHRSQSLYRLRYPHDYWVFGPPEYKVEHYHYTSLVGRFLACCPYLEKKDWRLIRDPLFCLWFCMGAKLGL
jgi:hypothetical protein